MVLPSWIEMILATQGQMLGTKLPEAWFLRVPPIIILRVQLVDPLSLVILRPARALRTEMREGLSQPGPDQRRMISMVMGSLSLAKKRPEKAEPPSMSEGLPHWGGRTRTSMHLADADIVRW